MSAVDQLTQGWGLHKAGNYAGAERCYQAVLAAQPENAVAWCYVGILRHDQRRYGEAEAAYRKSIAIQPHFPVALNNLGNTLSAVDRREEALECFDRAIALQPDYANAYKNKGAALHWLRRLEEAAACFQKTLELAPEDPQAHRDLGVTLLLQGRFAEAWPEYAWRWKMPASPLPKLRRPMWDGGSLDGKTIFLLGEQGMGDVVHFIRYAARLKQLYSCRAVASCHRPLLGLMHSVPGLDAAIPLGAELMEYDVFAPLLSIPQILGDGPDSFPAEVPYLQADEQLAERWRAELATFDGMRIGIVWQGNPDFEADRMRSAPLAAFEALGRLNGVSLISLQKGFGEEQLDRLEGRFDVIPLKRRLDNEGAPFLDTVAVLNSLDLVVTVDTVIAHIAGALGVPIWLALAYVPDWRWGLEGDKSRWYPTLRLFRQTDRGDWSSVFEAMAEALVAEHAPRVSRKPPAIHVEIAPGELLDKITILEIKTERITDPQKLQNVRHELTVLERARRDRLPDLPQLASLTAELKKANEALWDIEDAIRDCERQEDFGARFVELARSVYKTNDRRAALKRQINELLGSAIVEEKSYAEY
jgi:tetratricopeptide (TPR) repeat protein